MCRPKTTSTTGTFATSDFVSESVATKTSPADDEDEGAAPGG